MQTVISEAFPECTILGTPDAKIWIYLRTRDDRVFVVTDMDAFLREGNDESKYLVEELLDPEEIEHKEGPMSLATVVIYTGDAFFDGLAALRQEIAKVH
jgi:hypothetical protein